MGEFYCEEVFVGNHPGLLVVRIAWRCKGVKGVVRGERGDNGDI